MTDTALSIPAVAEPSRRMRLVRRFIGQKAFVVGTGILAVIVALALLAPLIAPHDPYLQNLALRNVPPAWYAKGSWLHPLGTDPLGRDYLSRVLYGARISLLIGVSVVLISGIIGTAMGLAAG